MGITSSHCSATDLPRSAQTFTLYLPDPFLLPIMNNACLVCPSMLIQASRFSPSLAHPPEPGLPFSATELSHQLQSCQFSLHPCAGCCWADRTRSPHQSAMTAKASLPPRLEGIHARPYCQAMWGPIPSASRKQTSQHGYLKWCSTKAQQLRQASLKAQKSNILMGCWSIQLL